MMLEVMDIDVYYGEIQALSQLSFKVNEGEIVALIGSNGAGKTTTLKTISGVLTPARGAIKFLGDQINGLPPFEVSKRGISHVLEGRRLFSNLTVFENLKMGSYVHEARKKFKENLEWVYQLFPVLKDRRGQLAKTLSGGEQQMLAIARALMSNPKLLLLDEPSQGLAPLITEKVFQSIDKINDEGVTILLVEQHVYDALDIADRGYILENGRVILEGKGKELLEMDEVKKAYLSL
jgi:branched-chain amino acid transport system ATP-binding protein